MSRKEKLKQRFKTLPSDFTWQELCVLLNGCGYELFKGTGSRRKFYNKSTGALISLHEPHPGSIVKKYALKDVLTHLEEQGEFK